MSIPTRSPARHAIALARGRAQTAVEEIANSITHGLGLLASLFAVPVLVLAAARQQDAWLLVGNVVYGATLVLLYLASTLYHALPPSRAKARARALDHMAIYLLIAGSYTPFLLGALRGPWGWSLLAAVWALAIGGMIAKAAFGYRFPRLSTAFYLVMGWMAVVAIGPLLTHLAPAGLGWLLAGGMSYTAGVAFYATDWRLRYGHTVWHLFVAAGSTCHFLAVLWHAAGRSS